VSYLLDTRTLLWFLAGDSRLSQAAEKATCSDGEVGVSCVSLWEIAIKKSLGKLKIESTIAEIADLCVESDIKVIPVESDVLDALAVLPFIHRDPFDRYLISLAQLHSMILITRDSFIPRYGVETLW
jgi:PIN domain nuclease of toxin-antitoxin system